MTGIHAVIPIKVLDGAKHRLSPLLTPAQRRELAEVMLREVLDAVAAAQSLAGVWLVTEEPVAIAIAAQQGWRVVQDGARDGHTGAVNGGIRAVLATGGASMLTLPGDIPAVTPQEIDAAIGAHGSAPAFTIVPAHDEQGSNTVICSPPDAVPLRFGDNSYFPHLDAARAAGIEPCILPLPGIGMDIDHPVDLQSFLRLPQSQGTRTRAWLLARGIR